jgi:outer membrane protein OmpA-like peptidoglycan-associated protein
MVLAGLLAARTAAAQGLDVEQFHPTVGGDGYLAVDGAFPVPHLTLTAGAFVNWSHRPLVVRTTSGPGGKGGDVLANRLGLDVLLTLGVADRLEFGLLLPAAFNFSPDNRILQIPGGIEANGVGDLRLDIKALIYGARFASGHRLGFSVAAMVSAPTGNKAAFASEDGWTGWPRLVIEWRARQNLAGLALTVGALLRADRLLRDLYVGQELTYGLGGRIDLTHGLELIAEGRGRTGIAIPKQRSFQVSESPFEIDFGLRYTSKVGLALTAAGGVGLTRGYGTPDGRFIFGLRYAVPLKKSAAAAAVRDSDGDGVPDEQDRCPGLRGPLANAGCPVTDSDGDGIDDTLDKCPDQKGPAVNGGCPDFDSDQDGVVDRLDKCPETPGPPPTGCPSNDQDGDGVPDAQDRCPDQAGSKENDGCPDIDSDGDGIVDRVDKCPFDPEVFNGVADDDGCPDPGPALAELQTDRIVVLEPIQFDKKNKVEPRSHRVLGVVAKLLELHPEILRVRIEGHTDNKGSAIDNLDISKARATAVRRHLIDVAGIDGKRLTAQGFGPDRPVADNKTEAGRAKNRRIEFFILEKAPAP